MSEVSGVSAQSGKTIKAVYEDESKKSVSIDNFLQMMIAQIQNQDPMNPIDDTQYVTQLAQFATMQQMQELAYYSRSNFVMGLVGKDVTVAKTGIGGKVEKITGPVEKISLVNNEYSIYVDGKPFALNQIMEIHPAVASGDSGAQEEVITQYGLALVETTPTSATVSWDVPTEEEDSDAARLRYSVYYSKSDEFDTVKQVKRGTLVGKANTTNISEMIIEDLEPGITYYVNVIMTDTAGNSYVYKKQAVTTPKE